MDTPQHVIERRRRDDYGHEGEPVGPPPARVTKNPYAVEAYLPNEPNACSKFTRPTQQAAEDEARRMHHREPHRAFMVYDRVSSLTLLELKALPLHTPEARKAWREERLKRASMATHLLCAYMNEIIPILDKQAETPEGAQGICDEAEMDLEQVRRAVFKVAQVRAMARVTVDHAELFEEE